MQRLRRIESPYIKEVRGKGLMIGLEVSEQARGARRFCEELAGEGILCKETHKTVVRFAPPLVISRAEIDWLADKVEEVFARIEARDQEARALA
jgi:ornithine--oxo-acid transaminase